MLSVTVLHTAISDHEFSITLRITKQFNVTPRVLAKMSNMSEYVSYTV